MQYAIPEKKQVVKNMEFPGVLKKQYLDIKYPRVIKKEC